MADIMEMNIEPEKLDYDTALGDIELDFAAADGEDELMLDEEQIVDQPMGDEFDASLDDEMADASNEIAYSDTAEVDMQAPQQAFVQDQIDLNFAEVPQSVTAESVAYAQSFADPHESANLDTVEHIPVPEASEQVEQPAEADTLDVGLGQVSSPKKESAVLPEDGESQVVQIVPDTTSQIEPSGTVSEDAKSAIDQPSQVSGLDPEQAKHVEQAEHHEEEHSHSGTVVIVEYEGTQLSLFSSTASQNIAGVPETYLLQDPKLGDSNISTLLTACREIFRESLLPFEELQMHLSQLDLSISEADAHTCGDAVTMNSLVDLYCALHRNDGNSEYKPLHIHLNRKHKALERLEYLHQALAEGKGFFDLDLDEVADEDGDSTPHAQTAVSAPSASQQSGTELLSHVHEENPGKDESQPAKDQAHAPESAAAIEGLAGSPSQDGKEAEPQDISSPKITSDADQKQNNANPDRPETLEDTQISPSLQNPAPTDPDNSAESQNEQASLHEKGTNEHAHPELPVASSTVHDLGTKRTGKEVAEDVDSREEQEHDESKDHITFEDPDTAEFEEYDDGNDGEPALNEGDIEEYDDETDEGDGDNASDDQEEGGQLLILRNGNYEVLQDEEDFDDFGEEDEYDDAAEQAKDHTVESLAEDIDAHNSSQETSTNKRARSLEYDDLESDPESKRAKP